VDTSISEQENDDPVSDQEETNKNPLSVIGDLSTNSVATAKATSQAVYTLVDSIVKGGMNMTFSWEKTKKKGASDTRKEEKRSRFFIDPPKTTYEWRRTPIPAQFLGVRDHVEIRDITEYKIFLNASVTEVLCTTTAEALAMGKFAIIPKHGKFQLLVSYTFAPFSYAFDLQCPTSSFISLPTVSLLRVQPNASRRSNGL
jgi:hypothetical protein